MVCMNHFRRAFTRARSWIAVSAVLISPSVCIAQTQEISFGVVPQQSASELAKAWIPVLQELAVRSNTKISFRTAPSIPAFEEQLKRGEYDLAYMNPYHYTVFSKTTGYRAFAKEKGRRLVGIVVVAKDSPITDIHQLRGKSVAFPAPAAFAASILPRAEFSRHGINIDAKYVSSHDSVYRGVAQGLFAAGGGIRRTLEAISPEVSGRLRVLATTPTYIPHAIAVHPRVPQAVVSRILAAMESMGRDEAGLKLLEPLSFKGIEAAGDKEWDEIRRLKIDQSVGQHP